MKHISAVEVATSLLLILVSPWMLVSCSSTSAKLSPSQHTPDEWASVVDKTIPEQKRAAKVKQLGLQLIELADSATQHIEELSKKAAVLNEDYGASREELQKLFDEFVKTRKLAFTKYRDIVFAMRSEVSAEEWSKLTK
jgi:hypothetical protein